MGISPEFYQEKFVCDGATDTMVCPAGHRMTPGEEHIMRWDQRPHGVAVKIYRTDQCRTCPHFMTRCTHNPAGRRICRQESQELLETMRARVKGEEGRELLALRRATAEHPFGTIKRAFDQGYLLLRGLRKVTGELGLTMLAYDLRRMISLIGTRRLVRHLTPRPHGRAWPD